MVMRLRPRLSAVLATILGIVACGGGKLYGDPSTDDQVGESVSFAGDSSIKGSIINTTDNTWYDKGGWASTMGPLSRNYGGMVCDNVDYKRFRTGAPALWFVAPSDLLDQFGVKYCGYNQGGIEPVCRENWNLCGRKIRIWCNGQNGWCAKPGEPSLLSQINSGHRPVNNYLPDYYIQQTTSWVGSFPSVPRSVVLIITDFCPRDHTENRKTGNCQSPQFDVSTAAFLLMGKMNDQGYINSNLDFYGAMLPENDQSSPGPEW